MQMATGPHAQGTNPITPPDAAQPATSEDDKVKAAEVAATGAAEKKANAADERFLVFTSPARAAAKVETRPSEAHAHASVGDAGSYSNRVGVGVAVATITEKQWDALGAPGPDTRWDKDNDWSIPVKAMTQAQVDYLLDVDPRYNGKRFELVDGNGQKVDR